MLLVKLIEPREPNGTHGGVRGRGFIKSPPIRFFLFLSADIKKMVLFSKKVAFREGEKCEKMASGEVELE